MAERSFTEEVQKLKVGAGQEFRGEGILAVTQCQSCRLVWVGSEAVCTENLNPHIVVVKPPENSV